MVDWAMLIKTCFRCGSEFARPAKYSAKQWATKRACSRKCGAWNLGVTKDKDPRMAAIAAQVSVSNLGRPGWNRGLTKHTDPRLMDISQKVSRAQVGKVINPAQRAALDAGREWARGKTASDTPSIRRRSEALSTTLRGRKCPEHSTRMKTRYAERPDLHPNAIVARKTKGHGYTGIERRVADMLDAMGVEYKFNDRVGAKWPDFKIEAAGLLIEADGERWHQDQKREAERDAYLEGFGWRVLHLTGTMIQRQPALCAELIREAVSDGQLHAPAIGVCA